MNMDSHDVLRFWFDTLEPAAWFRVDPALDQQITDQFQGLHTAVSRCECHDWRATPGGRLAEIIVLDQFSRNMYRDTAQAFAFDALALALAQEAISAGADDALPTERRTFLYLPFMHSESVYIHDIAVSLFSAPGMETNLDFELKHKAIIERFGRYPHRNTILGRESTPEEVDFLTQPGSSF